MPFTAPQRADTVGPVVGTATPAATTVNADDDRIRKPDRGSTRGCTVVATGPVGAGARPVLFQHAGFRIRPVGGNVDNHDISGLIAGNSYDLAFYGWSDGTRSSAVDVQHAGGTASSGRFGSTDP